MMDPPEKIFVNYRRGPTSSIAGRLYDRLVQKVPDNQVFMDVDTVEPGEDFRHAIENAISQSSVFLAIIGEGWSEESDPKTGNRRLDQPNDLVRLEIEAALMHKIRVIPVLVDNASMPAEDALPGPLRALAGRSAVEVRHTRFNDDIDGLVESIFKTVERGPKDSQEVQITRPKRGVASIVAAFSFVCIAISWTLPIHRFGLLTAVTAHIDAESVTFRTSDEVRDLIPFAGVKNSTLSIENAKLELSGGLPPHEPMDEGSLYIAKGAKSLNNFHVAGGAVLDFEHSFRKEDVSISIKSKNKSFGQVIVENDIEIELVSHSGTLELVEQYVDISEFISFEVDDAEFKPARIAFSPELPLTLRNIPISSLKFGHDLSNSRRNNKFVSTIKTGLIDIASIDEQINILPGEDVVLEDAVGYLRHFVIDEAISVRFDGFARRIETGAAINSRDRTPKLLPYLYHNHQLGFLFATACFVGASLWSLRRLLIH